MHQVFTAVVAASLIGPMPDGTVQFIPGFPVAIPNSNSVLVNGRVKVRPGFKLSHATVEYWQDGLDVGTILVKHHPDGRLGPTYVSGLPAGAEYNVMLRVVLTRKNEEIELRNISRVKIR